MSTVLVIGAGGVSSVCVHKMAMNADIFGDIHLASRTKSKCDAIAGSVKERAGVDVATYEIDAEEVPAMVNLIKKVQPKLREVVSRHIKILAKWFHTQFSWKKFLLFWMVMLIASKMVLLMLTYEFFSLTSLVSLEVGIFKIEFSGKWS